MGDDVRPGGLLLEPSRLKIEAEEVGFRKWAVTPSATHPHQLGNAVSFPVELGQNYDHNVHNIVSTIFNTQADLGPQKPSHLGVGCGTGNIHEKISVSTIEWMKLLDSVAAT